jgi:hypothetical protein
LFPLAKSSIDARETYVSSMNVVQQFPSMKVG